MLHRANELAGDALRVPEGSAGRVKDFYFDAQSRSVEFLAVETGGAVGGRTVLVPPAAIDRRRSSEQAMFAALPSADIERAPSAEKAREARLCSAIEMIGYAVEASDGPIGNVIDVMIDDDTWLLARIVIQTREWLPVRQFVLPAAAIAQLDPEGGRVRLQLARQEIESAPPT
jgi:hypothetical protein